MSYQMEFNREPYLLNALNYIRDGKDDYPLHDDPDHWIFQPRTVGL